MAMTELEAKREMYELTLMKRVVGPIGGLMSFNAEHGFVEAMLKGLRSGFLTEFEYSQLCLCETLEDVKLTLADTDFKSVLNNLQQRLTPEIMFDRCRQKTISEFDFLRKMAVGPLITFMDFITYEYLIASIQFVISGLVKGSNPETLLAKCHPLGKSPHLKSVLAFENFENDDGLVDLYKTVIVDTPVAPYFEKYFNSQIKMERSPREIQRHYDERDIDIITNMLQKLWLEDFYKYTQTLGGDTAVIMKELLEFEADRRALAITINSFGTELNDRQDLYCSFGTLYPEATLGKFNNVGDLQSLSQALQPYTVFHNLWQKAQEGGKSFTDLLYQHERNICVRAFESQSHFACFYAYTKLKQQEERNLRWILTCIDQGRDAKAKERWIRIF